MQIQRWSMVLLAVLVVAPAASASAQDEALTQEARDEEARAHFEAGRLAYAGSRYADSLTAFERAYELSNRPELLYNMGQCLDRLRRDGDAITTFERYLRELPGATNRVEVETRLEVLRTSVREREAISVSPEVLTAAPPPPAVHGGVETEWWFWTAIGGGAALIGAAIAIAVVSTSTTSTDPLYAGDVGPGGIVFALEGP